MPKLLQINTTLNYGSTGRIAEQIALLAQSKGWDCYIAHGARYINKSAIQSIQIGTKWGNYFHAFIGEFLGLHGLGSILSTFLFLKKIDKLKPDVIHLHNIHGYYLNYPLLFRYLSSGKTPVVWTFHDCWPFTGHCVHFEDASCTRWKEGCYAPCPCKGDYPKSLLFDNSERNYRLKKEYFTSVRYLHLVTVSKWLGELTKQSFLGDFPLRIIHNGINLNIFYQHKGTSELLVRYGLKDRHFILGVANVWEKHKGLNDFFHLRNILSLDDAIVIIGLSRQQRNNLPKGVIGIERTESQEELAVWYSAADVFVNPTYNDTLPTTNIEAIACGTPVVTYKTGGSPETIDENTGVVVEKGDIKGLANAIKMIKKNGKDYYSQVCRQRALRFFNKEERFVDYIKLYDKILSEVE